mgnify:CR=1 FL=1
MRQECIRAVGQVSGRTISQQEAQQIEQWLREAMKQVARQDVTAWQAMNRNDRLNAAAQVAGQQILNAASRKKPRVVLTRPVHRGQQGTSPRAVPPGRGRRQGLRRQGLSDYRCGQARPGAA